jgi:hypothetical protein
VPLPRFTQTQKRAPATGPPPLFQHQLPAPASVETQTLTAAISLVLGAFQLGFLGLELPSHCPEGDTQARRAGFTPGSRVGPSLPKSCSEPLRKPCVTWWLVSLLQGCSHLGPAPVFLLTPPLPLTQTTLLHAKAPLSSVSMVTEEK